MPACARSRSRHDGRVTSQEERREAEPARRRHAQPRAERQRVHGVRAGRHPSRHARGARAHRRVRRGRRRARHLQGRRLQRRPARRASCASRRTSSRTPSHRHPSKLRAVRPRPEERLPHGAGPGRLHQLQRGHRASSTWRPASTATRTQAGRRATSPGSTTTSSEMDTHEIAVGARDVPPRDRRRAQHRGAAAQHHQAHRHRAALRAWSASAIFRMCAEVVGGADELRARPIVYGGVCPVSPLKLPRDVTEVIIECARWGIPDNILSMAMAGGSSAGHPGRHPGHAQRRGARRHHAGAARGARLPR